MASFVNWLRAECDRAAGVGFLVAGAVCLAVGYAGVADASYVPQALSYIASGGFFGLLLVAVGSTLLITAALHDEWRKLDRIERAIDRLADRLGAADAAGEEAAAGNGRAPAAPTETVRVERAALASALAAPVGTAAAVTGPHSPAALLAGVAGLVGAAGLVAGGWTATASAVDDGTAYAALLLGIAGLAVAGSVSAGSTLAARRAARARQARLLERFGPYLDGGPAALPAAGSPAAASAGIVAVADGLSRFHRPGCASLAGLSIRFVERGEAAAAGLSECRLCEAVPAP